MLEMDHDLVLEHVVEQGGFLVLLLLDFLVEQGRYEILKHVLVLALQNLTYIFVRLIPKGLDHFV